MKKIVKVAFLVLFYLTIVFQLSAEDIKELFTIKTEVSAAYPIFLHDLDSAKTTIAPFYKIQLDFPINNNFGVCGSVNFYNYSINQKYSSKFIPDSVIARIFNLSALTGVYYRFKLNDDWFIVPDVQAGLTWENSISDRKRDYYSFVAALSVGFERKLTNYWTVYGTSSFGYYYHSCPVSAGLGFSYIVE